MTVLRTHLHIYDGIEARGIAALEPSYPKSTGRDSRRFDLNFLAGRSGS